MQSKSRLSFLVMAALITSILCILAPLSIPLPFSPVPFTLTNLILLFAVYLLPWKWAWFSCLIYLLLGTIGLPVFSGFAGGLGKLAGPTGGYLIGFLLQVPISGLFLERFRSRLLLCAVGMVLGIAACYALGTVWLALQMHLSLKAALLAGVIPYLPGDAVKIVAALLLGPVLSRSVSRAQTLQN